MKYFLITCIIVFSISSYCNNVMTIEDYKARTQAHVNTYLANEVDFEYGDYIYPILQEGLEVSATYVGKAVGGVVGEHTVRWGVGAASSTVMTPLGGALTGYLGGRYVGRPLGKIAGGMGGFAAASVFNTKFNKGREQAKFENKLFLQNKIDEFQTNIIGLDQKFQKVLDSKNLKQMYESYEDIFFDKSKALDFEGLTEKDKADLKAGKFEFENKDRQRKIQKLLLERAAELQGKVGYLNTQYGELRGDLSNLKNKFIATSKRYDDKLLDLTSIVAAQNRSTNASLQYLNDNQNKMMEYLEDMDPNVDPLTKLIRKKRRDFDKSVLRGDEFNTGRALDRAFVNTVDTINDGLDAINEYMPAAMFLSNIGIFDDKTSALINTVASTISSLKSSILPALMTGGISGYFTAANAALALFSGPQKNVKHEQYMKAFETIMKNQQIMNKKLDALLEGQKQLYKQNIIIMANISNLKFQIERLDRNNRYQFNKLYMSIYDLHRNYQTDQLANLNRCFSIVNYINDIALRSDTYDQFYQDVNSETGALERFDECYYKSFLSEAMFSKNSIFYERGVSHLSGEIGKPSLSFNVFEKLVKTTFGPLTDVRYTLNPKRYRFVPALDFTANSIYLINAKLRAVKKDRYTYSYNYIPENKFYSEVFKLDSKESSLENLTVFSQLYNAKVLVQWTQKLLNYISYYPFFNTDSKHFIPFGEEFNSSRVRAYIKLLKESVIPTLSLSIKQQTLASGDVALYTLYNEIMTHESMFHKIKTASETGSRAWSFTEHNKKWQMAAAFSDTVKDKERFSDRIFMLKHSPILRENFNMYLWHKVFKSDPEKYREFYSGLTDLAFREKAIKEYKLGSILSESDMKSFLLLPNEDWGQCSTKYNKWYVSWAGLRGENFSRLYSNSKLQDKNTKGHIVLSVYRNQTDPIKKTSVVLCLPTPDEFVKGNYYQSEYVDSLVEVRENAILLLSKLEIYYEEKYINNIKFNKDYYIDNYNELRASSIISSEE